MAVSALPGMVSDPNSEYRLVYTLVIRAAYAKVGGDASLRHLTARDNILDYESRGYLC